MSPVPEATPETLKTNEARMNFGPSGLVAGAKIETPRGTVPIETLCVGDLVEALDQGAMPILWIRRISVLAVGVAAPVLFRKGALGNDADFWAAPQHRVLLRGSDVALHFGENEVLAPAISLVNGTSIQQIAGREVDYFQLLLDHHALLSVGGCWTETFHPDDCGLDAMSPFLQADLRKAVPRINADANAYGPLARLVLRDFEVNVLLQEERKRQAQTKTA